MHQPHTSFSQLPTELRRRWWFGGQVERPARYLACGRIEAYCDGLDKWNDNRRVCSLYLSLMDRMGISLDRFGDSDQRLAGL